MYTYALKVRECKVQENSGIGRKSSGEKTTQITQGGQNWILSIYIIDLNMMGNSRQKGATRKETTHTI